MVGLCTRTWPDPPRCHKINNGLFCQVSSELCGRKINPVSEVCGLSYTEGRICRYLNDTCVMHVLIRALLMWNVCLNPCVSRVNMPVWVSGMCTRRHVCVCVYLHGSGRTLAGDEVIGSHV